VPQYGGVTAILGLNAFHGDAAAALLIDGQLVAAAEEERFNRVKHCAGFPEFAARWCLEDAGLEPGDLDHVAVSRDPKANLGRKLMRTIRHGASARYLKARLENAAKVRDVRSALARALDVAPDALRAEVHNVEHHQAHVASAFFVSPFEQAAVLSADGFGDFASTMLTIGRGNLFQLGLDYFTHDKEGVDMTWDEQTPTIGQIFSDRMVEAFGPAREPRTELERRHEDVAAGLQAMLEEAYLHLVQELWERTRLPALCLAGGVALNAVANGRIRLETPFEDVYVQPAAGGSGR